MSLAMDGAGLTPAFQELINRFSADLFEVGRGRAPVLLYWPGGDDTFASDIETLKKPFRDCAEAGPLWPLKYARSTFERWSRFRTPNWLTVGRHDKIEELRRELRFDELTDEEREKLLSRTCPGAPWHLPYLCLFSHIASNCPRGFYVGINKALNTRFDASGSEFRQGAWSTLWTSIEEWSAPAMRGRFVVQVPERLSIVGYPQQQGLIKRSELLSVLKFLCEEDLGPREIKVVDIKKAASKIQPISTQLQLTLESGDESSEMQLLHQLVISCAERDSNWDTPEPLDSAVPREGRVDGVQTAWLRLVIEFDYSEVTSAYLEPRMPSDCVVDNDRGLACGGEALWLRSADAFGPKDVREMQLYGCGPDSTFKFGNFTWRSQAIRVLVPDGFGRWIESRVVPQKGDVLVLMKDPSPQEYADVVSNQKCVLKGWLKGEMLLRVDVASLDAATDIGSREPIAKIKFEGGIRPDQRLNHYFGFALPRVSTTAGGVVTVDGTQLNGDRLAPVFADDAVIAVGVDTFSSKIFAIIPMSPELTEVDNIIAEVDPQFSLREPLDEALSVHNEPALLLVQALAHRLMSDQSARNSFRDLVSIYRSHDESDQSWVIRNLADLGHIESCEVPGRQCEFLRACAPVVMVGRYSVSDARRVAWLVGGHRWSNFRGYRHPGIQWHRTLVGSSVPPRVSAVGAITDLRALAKSLNAHLIGQPPLPEFPSFVQSAEPRRFGTGFPFDPQNIKLLNPFKPSAHLGLNGPDSMRECCHLMGDNGVFAFTCDTEAVRSGWYLGRIREGKRDGWCRLESGRDRDITRWSVVCNAWRRLADITGEPGRAEPPLVYLPHERMICVPPQLPFPAEIRRWLCSKTGTLPAWPTPPSRARLEQLRLVVEEHGNSISGDLFVGGYHGYGGQAEADAKSLCKQIGLRCMIVSE